MTTETPHITFQGQAGAYSHMACLAAYPDYQPLPCETFEDAFAAVEHGKAELAMIPIENSVAGRVADIHRLLPDSGLHIIAERFQRVRHQLLGLPGASIKDLRSVHSHVHALAQCHKLIHELCLVPMVEADTAGAASAIAGRNDSSQAAIASSLAAETYGLDVLRADIEDADHNTTRFLVMAREPEEPEPGAERVLTSFVFRVRNIPAALYKALGGFATNGVNMIKLESYMLDGSFSATQFYSDIEGHPSEEPVRLALEELGFFSRDVKILGVYPADSFRNQNNI
ncbi:MAG: prephenate dehydratase [Alphaproteobacteria bacterium]|nr:prephenate dehydratase [Alphaproteobacteria bacterium]